MRRVLSLLLLATAVLPAQQKLPYDPNDPEGLVPFPNGTGRYAWKRPGHWKLHDQGNPTAGANYGTPRATPAEIAQMKAVRDQLAAILKATEEGSKPIGWWMLDSRVYHNYNQYDLPPNTLLARYPLEFSSGFFPFYIEDTKKNGVYVQAGGGETESMQYRFNILPGRMQREVIAKEESPNRGPIEFYPKPRVTRDFFGYPMYEKSDVVITRNGRDPWAPVPYGRALKAALAQFEADVKSAEDRLANYKKKNEETQSPDYEKQMRDNFEKNNGALRTSRPSNYTTRLASMERELKYNRDLAAKQASPQRDKDGNWYWHPVDALEDIKKRLASLTPEEAAKPSCFLPAAKDQQGRYQMRGDIQIAGPNPACEPLVMDNHAYFDPKLPRSAPQILVVWNAGRCAYLDDPKAFEAFPFKSLNAPQGCYRHQIIWKQMDWQKVAALLVP